MELTDWLSVVSLVLAVEAFRISRRSALYEHLAPPRLEWFRPLAFSLDDQKDSRPPAIAVDLTIHNAGAQPGRVEDIALSVTRIGNPSVTACFQAHLVAQGIPYLTVPLVEEKASPMRPIVVGGHDTKTVVVEFTKRSAVAWNWCPGEYSAEVHSFNHDEGWVNQATFEFTVGKADVEALTGPSGVSVRVDPVQRWTKHVTARRDEFCDRFGRISSG